MQWRGLARRASGEVGGRVLLVVTGSMTLGMVLLWTFIVGYEGGVDTQDPQVVAWLFWRLWTQLPPVLAFAAHGAVTLLLAVLPLPVRRLLDLEKRAVVLTVGVAFLWAGSAIWRVLAGFEVALNDAGTALLAVAFGLGILVTGGFGVVLFAVALTPGEVQLRGGLPTFAFTSLFGTAFLVAGAAAFLGLWYVALRDGAVTRVAEWALLVVGAVFGAAFGGVGALVLRMGLAGSSLPSLDDVRSR